MESGKEMQSWMKMENGEASRMMLEMVITRRRAKPKKLAT